VVKKVSLNPGQGRIPSSSMKYLHGLRNSPVKRKDNESGVDDMPKVRRVIVQANSKKGLVIYFS
jgi:hypothetical protein